MAGMDVVVGGSNLDSNGNIEVNMPLNLNSSKIQSFIGSLNWLS